MAESGDTTGLDRWDLNPDVRLTPTGAQESTKRKVVLVTGAAGSLGALLVAYLARMGHTVRAMDMNESGLAALAQQNVRLIYGDIRDAERVHLAARGADHIIHAAAMKNLTISEKNPWEVIRTNVSGTRNVALAAINNNVRKAIFVSSDKAVEPTTLYGSTKLLGEQLWLWFAKIQERVEFPIFRSGNFNPSSGSVFEVWERQHRVHQALEITDPDMVRYFIPLGGAAMMLVGLLDTARNAQVIVPKMERIRIMDLKNRLYPEDQVTIMGCRPGEKMEEKLFHDHEKKREEKTDYWVVER